MLDIRRRTGYLFLAVMMGHVILISAQVQNRGGARLVSEATFGVVSRIQLATARGVDGFRGLWHNYIWLRGARAENETLRRQVVELGAQVEEQRARLAQIGTLEEAINLRKSLPVQTITARVIAGDPTPGFPAVTIDRGSADGLRANMAVIAPRGVVGRIYGRLEEHAAQVQLIVGRSAGAAAYLDRTAAGGNVIGRGSDDPPLQLDDVSNIVDVQVGDLVLTSGLDGIFPRGFTIGRVERAVRGSGTWGLAIRPTVDFSNLQFVLVITTPPSARWAQEADKR